MITPAPSPALPEEIEEAITNYGFACLVVGIRNTPARLEERGERHADLVAAIARQGVAVPEEMRAMSEAPRDRTAILLKLKDQIPEKRDDLRRWDGLSFVGLHFGLADDGFDMGWQFAAPVGHGGFPDEWFDGWRSLSTQPTRSSEPAPQPGQDDALSHFRMPLQANGFEIRDDSRELMATAVTFDRAKALVALANATPAPHQDDDEPALACVDPIGCTAPCHDDDGVNYCDVCGRFEGCRIHGKTPSMLAAALSTPAPRQDDAQYHCPECGTTDTLGYENCDYPICPAGHDQNPAPRQDDEIARLRADVVWWKKTCEDAEDRNVKTRAELAALQKKHCEGWHQYVAAHDEIERLRENVKLRMASHRQSEEIATAQAAAYQREAKLATLTEAARAVVKEYEGKEQYWKSIVALDDALRAVLASQTPREHPDLSGLRRALELPHFAHGGYAVHFHTIRAEIARLQVTP